MDKDREAMEELLQKTVRLFAGVKLVNVRRDYFEAGFQAAKELYEPKQDENGLLPCPFCGRAALFGEAGWGCPELNCPGCVVEASIIDWNMRAKRFSAFQGGTMSEQTLCQCGHDEYWHNDPRLPNTCRNVNTVTGLCSCIRFTPPTEMTPKHIIDANNEMQQAIRTAYSAAGNIGDVPLDFIEAVEAYGRLVVKAENTSIAARLEMSHNSGFVEAAKIFGKEITELKRQLALAVEGLNGTADSLGNLLMWVADEELKPLPDTPESIAESIISGAEQLEKAREVLDKIGEVK